MFVEILSTEQPCILCGMALEVVTISRDHDTGEERIERTRLAHTDSECRAFAVLSIEEWPVSATKSVRT